MKIWLVNIFEHEFGFSDVLSNYSRVYAWMANQLGHMTLGLLTVFAFHWIADSVTVALRAAPAHPVAILAGAATVPLAIGTGVRLARNPPERWLPEGLWTWLTWHPARAPLAAAGLFVAVLGLREGVETALPGLWAQARAELNAGLLAVSGMVLTLFVVAMLWLALRRNPGLDGPPGAAKGPRRAQLKLRFAPFDRGARWLAAALIATAVLAALAGAWAAEDLAPQARREFVGIVAAGLVVGVVILALAKDYRFAVLGLLAVLGAVVVAVGVPMAVAGPQGPVRPVSLPPRPWVVLGLGVTFGLVALGLLVWKGRSKQTTRADRWLLGVLGGTGAAVYVLANWVPLDPDWARPVGAAMAAVALWWVKEFGSDLPNVQLELSDAEAARRRAGVIESEEDDAEAEDLDRGYFRDALWDTRTDALFYVAGAWIGAGVLSRAAILDDGLGAWGTGSEIVGSLVFLTVFLGCGRNWAYRQQALDRTGTVRANRLALVVSRLALHVPDSDGAFRPDAAVPQPRKRLLDFATGRTDFRHLILIGDEGAGKRRLADALVTEAALVDLPPGIFAPQAPAPRSGRYITFRALLRDMAGGTVLGALPSTPTQVLWVAKPAPGQHPLQAPVLPLAEAELRKSRGPDAELWQAGRALPAAHLVAIGDCQAELAPEDLSQPGRHGVPPVLAEVVGRLAGGDQRTVWVYEVEGQAESALWLPQSPVLDVVATLRRAWTRRHGDPGPIAVVFVSRSTADPCGAGAPVPQTIARGEAVPPSPALPP